MLRGKTGTLSLCGALSTHYATVGRQQRGRPELGAACPSRALVPHGATARNAPDRSPNLRTHDFSLLAAPSSGGINLFIPSSARRTQRVLLLTLRGSCFHVRRSRL